MSKVNASLLTCEHCSEERACAVTQYENGDEFTVCYSCGKVEAKRKFEALDYVVSLMQDGITRQSELAECLTDKLSDEYYWMDNADNEALAKLMTRELYDKAMFEHIAKVQEQAEDAREFNEAKAGRY